jgi:hypothetical protein
VAVLAEPPERRDFVLVIRVLDDGQPASASPTAKTQIARMQGDPTDEENPDRHRHDDGGEPGARDELPRLDRPELLQRWMVLNGD